MNNVNLGFLLSMAAEALLDPERPFLQGRESAEEYLKRFRVNDPEDIETVLKTSLRFSEFQEIGLYHKSGLFNTMVDYQHGMPMLPQALSPLFGKAMTEYFFQLYDDINFPNSPNPTFLELGAGQGFLAHDSVAHILSKSFGNEKRVTSVDAFRKESKFIITDRIQNSLGLLRRELSDLLEDERIKGKVEIQKLDALDFSLGQYQYGIIFANELVDATPTELIVNMGGEYYSIRVLPLNPNMESEEPAVIKKLSSSIGVKGIVPEKKFREALENGYSDQIKFVPVFVPLKYDKFLSHHAARLSSVRNINSDDFGGIYPVSIGLHGLFTSVRRSFQHGVVVLIDYYSFHNGHHNWNKAVNQFRFYRIGKMDIDFQIDPQQVTEVASKNGFEQVSVQSLRDLVSRHTGLIQDFEMNDLLRWATANRQLRGKQYPEIILRRGMQMAYETLISIAEGYAVMTYKF